MNEEKKKEESVTDLTMEEFIKRRDAFYDRVTSAVDDCNLPVGDIVGMLHTIGLQFYISANSRARSSSMLETLMASVKARRQ